MTLTHEQVKRLNEPFEPNDHEFLRGYIYITEYAIVARLSEVDPSWSWQIKTQYRNGNQVVTAGTLTVCGVSRDGVGEAIAEYKADTGRQVNEAEKSSVTDALKRASRLFGIGSYLLTTPDFVKTPKDVAKWLNGSNTPATQRPNTNPPIDASRRHNPTPPPNWNPDLQAQLSGDFMDVGAPIAVTLFRSGSGTQKNGTPYATYTAKEDASTKVNVFEKSRPDFEKLGLPVGAKFPDTFYGVIERTPDGQYWNLKSITSF